MAPFNCRKRSSLPKHHPKTPWAIAQGERLRAARLAAGLSQTAVAHHLDCTYQMVQRLEHGTAHLSAERAVLLANFLNVDLRQLLGVTP
ncbi:helix-turn-helix domain-containing protein [Hyphomicrobium sp. DY-1]|uniref:helix-turn-helix domain-containing protein n=1 Tax=Hyphomicrobium sp. DY-1 TaxID=3075650 RepID=UPI0039C15667